MCDPQRTPPPAPEHALLRSVFDSALSAIVAMDLDGKVTDCNAAAWRALGLAARVELLGRRASAFAINRAEVEAGLAAVASDSAARKLECVVKVGDAPLRTLELSVSPHRSAEGRLLGLVAVAHDIAERKRITDSLRLVNELAIEFAAAPASVDPFEMVAEKVRAALDARALVISSYDPAARELTVRHVTLAGGVLAAVNKILGKNFVGRRLDVGPAMEQKMLSEVVSDTTMNLAELSFGALSSHMIDTLANLVGIGEVHGMALKHGGVLYGSMLLVLPPCEHSPSRELLHLLANLSAVTLRRPHTPAGG